MRKHKKWLRWGVTGAALATVEPGRTAQRTTTTSFKVEGGSQ